jgi:hypothetical protein
MEHPRLRAFQPPDNGNGEAYQSLRSDEWRARNDSNVCPSDL